MPKGSVKPMTKVSAKSKAAAKKDAKVVTETKA
jgi:hypothetical protein